VCFTPHWPVSQQALKQIDHAGRTILERVGVRICDRRFLEMLQGAGARVHYEDQRAFFEQDRLDYLLEQAPSRFTLYSRDGRNDLPLGEGRVYFANGGRVFRILDMDKGCFRPSLLADVARTARLVNELDRIHFYIIACQAEDVQFQHYHLNDFYHAFKHTTKHVMGGCDHLEGVKQMWRLASFIAGGEEALRERPFVSVITNPISPLTMAADALNTLHFCCSQGIPTTCAPAPIAGATSPATLAGTLSQMHAEALAGVALSQVFAPGSKVLYGAVPAVMDLRSADIAMGSVEMGLMNACAVQLAKLYGLPIYASAGVTESKGPDIQAGIEKSFSNLTVAMAGADCIHLAAGMIDSANSISYEQYVIDNEIIGMTCRILEGIRVNERTLGLDVIEKIGPGGNYIMEDHTVEHMTEEFFYPSLGVRLNLDLWDEKNRPDMVGRARALVKEILERSGEDLLDKDLIHEVKKAFPGIENP